MSGDSASPRYVTLDEVEAKIDFCVRSMRQEMQVQVAGINTTIAEKIAESDAKRLSEMSELKTALSGTETKLFQTLVGIAGASVLALLTLYITLEMYQKDSVKSGFDVGTAVQKNHETLDDRIDRLTTAVEGLARHQQSIPPRPSVNAVLSKSPIKVLPYAKPPKSP